MNFRQATRDLVCTTAKCNGNARHVFFIRGKFIKLFRSALLHLCATVMNIDENDILDVYNIQAKYRWIISLENTELLVNSNAGDFYFLNIK